MNEREDRGGDLERATLVFHAGDGSEYVPIDLSVISDELVDVRQAARLSDLLDRECSGAFAIRRHLGSGADRGKLPI